MRTFWERLRGFWGREELQILGLNLALHTAVQVVALQFMPLPYYSRLSLHDGNTYFRVAQNLWSARPIELYTWHKRFLHVLVARLAIPWNLELSFLVSGIVAASLSAVYFFKIATRYTKHPLRLTLLYSVLPWLFFAAHHGLNEPLLMLTLLAGLYYYLEERDWACTVAFALALLTKELAAFVALGVGLLILYRRGWRRALLFATALLPLATFCLVYGWRWGDCVWCLKLGEGHMPEGFFSLRTGLYWIVHTLIHGTQSSANPTVAFLYDVGNQILNVGLLLFSGLGVYRLWRRGPIELAFINSVALLPIWFMGGTQYNLNSSVGRKFLLVSSAIVAYDSWLGTERPALRFAYWLTVAGLLGLGVLWTLLYAKFFLFFRLF
jgi:hypothetical protein